jgi:hypothetical protein
MSRASAGPSTRATVLFRVRCGNTARVSVDSLKGHTAGQISRRPRRGRRDCQKLPWEPADPTEDPTQGGRAKSSEAPARTRGIRVPRTNLVGCERRLAEGGCRLTSNSSSRRVLPVAMTEGRAAVATSQRSGLAGDSPYILPPRQSPMQSILTTPTVASSIVRENTCEVEWCEDWPPSMVPSLAPRPLRG